MVFDRNWKDLFDEVIKGAPHSIEIPLPNGYNNWKQLRVAHTHPEEFGGTFSVKDITEFRKARPISTSAVANEGIYTIEQIEGKRHNWVNLAKKYEQQYAETHNRLFDELESVCMDRGIPATREELDTIRKNIANEVHEWLKSNSEKYGFYYTFIST